MGTAYSSQSGGNAVRGSSVMSSAQPSQSVLRALPPAINAVVQGSLPSSNMLFSDACHFSLGFKPACLNVIACKRSMLPTHWDIQARQALGG
ncbi:hypothetical protein HaLaN_27395 [Haematococcus lacustris]|uniref:Uncharacterized protein n=1 Tax=Haematococcus lacustris TaxID=44745 RepID=A0A6A0A844_HAELA|nr:hypothetical protein HaLaN_27395 [Haematococcus lacustris]